MSSPREIRTKVAGIAKIQKITRAMQNVAASKMRSAKERMLTSIPYATKIREVAQHLAASDEEFNHPYLKPHGKVTRVGFVLVSSDRGLCGGLNLNLFKLALERARSLQQQGVETHWCLFGKKALSFFKPEDFHVVARIERLGDLPKMEHLLGGIKVMLDAYKVEELDEIYLLHNEFVNTVSQRPVIKQLLPLGDQTTKKSVVNNYIYEPKNQYYNLIDTVITRYLETQVYQAVVDNVACEQVARMMAMQNATDNAKALQDELLLMYNKARQAAITNELAEIIGGAEAL